MKQIINNISLINTSELKLYINGQWKHATDRATFQILNPSNKKPLANIPLGGRKEANDAIHAAEKSFTKWAKLTAYERGEYLLQLRDLLIEYKDELATIMSMEMGKVKKQAIEEVIQASSFLTWYAEEGKRVYGETIPGSQPHKRLLVIKQPVGVVAAITPWNFPLAMLTRKLAPAMAAGCTSIVKPASQASLTALAFAELVS